MALFHVKQKVCGKNILFHVKQSGVLKYIVPRETERSC